MNYDLLKKARIEAGFTQEEMAKNIGYSTKSSYCLVENGTVNCTVELSRRIKETLNLTLQQYNDIFLQA